MARLYPIHVFGGFGYIDAAGQTVVPADLSWAREFSGGLGAARKSGWWGYVDVTGAFVIERQFTDAERFVGRFAVVSQGDRRGVIDSTGAWVVEPEWERIYADGDWWHVADDGAVGWIDGKGRLRLVGQGVVVSGDASTAVLLKGAGGVARLDLATGTQVVLPCDEADRPGADTIPARMADRWGWLDYQGGWLLPPQWASVSHFFGDYAIVRTSDGKAGLIDRAANFVMPARYRSIRSWRWGDPHGWLAEDEHGLWQHDAQGHCVGGPWLDTLVTGSANLTMVQSAGGWGAVDENGRMLLDPGFEELADAGEGLLLFRRGKCWGILDTRREQPMRVEAELNRRPSAFHDGLAAMGWLEAVEVYIDTLGRDVWRRPSFRSPAIEPMKRQPADWALAREALQKLASDPTSLFGARDGERGHQFRLGPILSEEQIGQLEQRHAITLPADYRSFLIEVGNGPATPNGSGGAGPGHGLYEITGCLDGDDHLREHFIPPRTHAGWKAASEDSGFPKGLVVIGTLGCAYDYGLVVSGPWSGTVWNCVDPGWIPSTSAWGEILASHHDDYEAAHAWCWEHLEELPIERFADFYMNWLVEALGRMG